MLGERLSQAPEIAGGIVHVGLGDLDIVQPHDGIDVDGMRLGALAHDLTMNLALRRHVDDEIAAELRLTSEPAARLQRPALVDIALLDRIPRRRVILRGIERMLGEFALHDLDLAARADAAPAAHGIEIDAELARRFEHAGSVLELAALARRRKDDAMLAQIHQPRARLRPSRRPPSPSAGGSR